MLVFCFFLSSSCLLCLFWFVWFGLFFVFWSGYRVKWWKLVILFGWWICVLKWFVIMRRKGWFLSFCGWVWIIVFMKRYILIGCYLFDVCVILVLCLIRFVGCLSWWMIEMFFVCRLMFWLLRMLLRLIVRLLILLCYVVNLFGGLIVVKVRLLLIVGLLKCWVLNMLFSCWLVWWMDGCYCVL